MNARKGKDEADGNQDKESSEDSSPLAGSLRNVSLRILRLLSSQRTSPLFTKKMLTRVISKSQIHDASEHFHSIKNETKHLIRNLKSNDRKAFSSYAKNIGLAGVLIAKSIALGGVVFSVYENSRHWLWKRLSPNKSVCGEFTPNESPTMFNLQYENILHSSKLSCASGLLAGVVHGALYHAVTYNSIFDILEEKKRSVFKTQKISFVMFSHGLVYATLFGTYDFGKRSSAASMKLFFQYIEYESPTLHFEGAVSVVVGAGIAGFLSEIVNSLSHLACESSRNSILSKKGTRGFNLQSRYFRSLIPAMGSTIVGFLAYEYTKEMLASLSQ